MSGQHIRFFLKEIVEQIPREPSREDRWGPVHDYRATGRLSLEIDGWHRATSVRRRWRDSTRRKLEDQLGEFVVTIEAIGEVERREEEERERQRQREAEARARAAVLEELRRREAEREARLIELSRSWRAASDLRVFLGEMERTAAGTDGLEELIAWGRTVADKLDPLSGPSSEVLTELAPTD